MSDIPPPPDSSVPPGGASYPPPGASPPPGGFAPPGAPGINPTATQYPMAADPWAQWQPLVPTPGRRFLSYLLEALLVIVTLVIGWLIWWVICWQTGQTPAKRIMKMRCMNVETNRCAGMGEMAMRELVGKYLLGNISCGITTIVGGVQILQGSPPLWDKVAKTILIDDPDDRYAPPPT